MEALILPRSERSSRKSRDASEGPLASNFWLDVRTFCGHKSSPAEPEASQLLNRPYTIMKRSTRPCSTPKIRRPVFHVGQHYPRIIYVLELSPAAASDPLFAAANPGYVSGMPCCYVGSSSQTAEQRFHDHIVGHNASRLAHQYAVKLRFDLMPEQKPMPRARALREEKRLARFLRSRGFGVWQQ